MGTTLPETGVMREAFGSTEAKSMFPVTNFRRPDESVPQVVKVIPNTAIETRQSMTFLAPVNADKKHLEQVRAVFNKAGKTLLVKEKMLGAGTTLASCGIGYAMAHVKAASEGGKELGFTDGAQFGLGAAAFRDSGLRGSATRPTSSTPLGFSSYASTRTLVNALQPSTYSDPRGRRTIFTYRHP
ncbi:MAG: pyrroline-5-carboxylate reductase family protein [Candidatus Cryptobacteroides sp.]